MPKVKWTGYKRFCPLASGLDLIGERWILIIIQELLASPKRYTDLQRRIPGIGTSVLADRLRKLEQAGLVARQPGKVGEAITYILTDAGQELSPVLRAIREWGVRNLISSDTTAIFNVSYVEQIELLPDEEYEWHIDGAITTLIFSQGNLRQRSGVAQSPAVIIYTSAEFMQRWAAGDIDWEGGLTEGSVQIEGQISAWRRMLAATGYNFRYEPEIEAKE